MSDALRSLIMHLVTVDVIIPATTIFLYELLTWHINHYRAGQREGLRPHVAMAHIV